MEKNTMARNVAKLLAAGVLGTALLKASPSSAQHMNAENGPCPDVVVTSDLSECFNRAYKQADAELNAVYRRIMAVLNEDGKTKLRSAQRAWIAYRDAACAAEASPYRDGSAFGDVELACLEAATRQRVEFMKAGLWWRVEKFGE